MANVVRDKEMQVPINALYRAITDFESYPKFLPEVVSVKREGAASDTEAKVVFEIEVVKKFQYTLHFQMKNPTEVKWTLVESNFFKGNSGLWSLKDLGGNKTQVHYELDVSFGFLVPGWISKKLTETSLPKMFENFEGQARKVAG